MFDRIYQELLNYTSPNNGYLDLRSTSLMAKNKKSSVKNALSSQQSRLKKKQEVKQAVEHQAMKSKSKTKAPPQRSTIPFLPTDRILLIGEGNFSYALALVLHPPPGLEHLPSENVTATAYDSEDECYTKYPEAVQYVQTLRGKGAQIMFGVDATKLERCSPLKGKRYDRIVWNFPHAGERDQPLILDRWEVLMDTRKGYH